uniref:Reactive oxygen species modulator 1 n=1 Tax=Setaria digitata TaxID=48799 RepID=A0A915Q770_9BILA
MAVPQYQGVSGHPQITCWQKMKMGLLMGVFIGCASGAIIGTASAISMGFRGRAMMAQVGRYSTKMGGSFAVFMMIAQGLRC